LESGEKNINVDKILDKRYHLTLQTVLLEINESRLSDTRCLMHDVVSPHCGDKRMVRRSTRRSLPNSFDMTSYHWNVKQNTVTTSCDAVSLRNRQDLIQGLVPPHYIYVISLSNISIKTNFKQIARVELKCVQYSEGDYILCMTSTNVACLIQGV
jgi:hypothetical protein